MNHSTARAVAQICALAFVGAVAAVSLAAQDAPPPTAGAKQHPATETGKDGGGSPADATAILDRLAKTLGDHVALEKLERLKFHFVIESGGKVNAQRTSQVDLARDLVRFDLKTKQGDVACAFTLKGDGFAAKQNGVDVDPKEALQVYEQARKTFRGDFLYLTLASRLREPGFVVKLDGEVEVEKKKCDRLAITFDASANAPVGDKYWLVIDRESGLPRAMLVKWYSMEANQKPLRFDYGEWKTLGGVKLPMELKGVGNPQTLKFDELSSPEKFADDTFFGINKS